MPDVMENDAASGEEIERRRMAQLPRATMDQRTDVKGSVGLVGKQPRACD
jgi:hypothetical protein